jgi:hypothetical protein
MTSPAQCTMHNVVCRSMTMEARYAASASGSSHWKPTDLSAVIRRSFRWQINRRVFGMSVARVHLACDVHANFADIRDKTDSSHRNNEKNPTRVRKKIFGTMNKSHEVDDRLAHEMLETLWSNILWFTEPRHWRRKPDRPPFQPQRFLPPGR